MDHREFLSRENADESKEQNVRQDQDIEERQTNMQQNRNEENDADVSNVSHAPLPPFGSALVRTPFSLDTYVNISHNYNSEGLNDDQTRISDDQSEGTPYLWHTAGIPQIADSLDMASDSAHTSVPDFNQSMSSNLNQQNDQTTSFSHSENQVSHEWELLNYPTCLPTYSEGNNMPPDFNPIHIAETLNEQLCEQITTMIDGFPPLNIVGENTNNKVDDVVPYTEDYDSIGGPLAMPTEASPVNSNSLPTKYLSSGFDQELNQRSLSQARSHDNMDTEIVRYRNARVSMGEDDPPQVNSTMDLQAEFQVKETPNDDGEKPFPCKKCQKRFKHQSALSRHSRLHTGGKPYKCENCGKCFSRKDTLKEHSRTHEQPHKCEVCGKGFAQKSDLDKHSQTCSSERPHKCEVCGKGFSRKGDLNKHSVTHSDKRPHKCNLCGRAFAQKAHLEYHSGTHSDDTSFKCKVCGRGFSKKEICNRHTRTHFK